MTVRFKLMFVTFLTFVRFPLVLLFFVAGLVHSGQGRPLVFWLAFLSLVTSAVTDIFDGYFARRFKVETSFGAHADPLMDKFFYLTTLPFLVFLACRNGHIAHSIFLLIITMFFLTRDQWVTFLRSIGSMYNVSGKANWAGKLRTSVNFPLICAIYLYEASPFESFPFVVILAFEIIALMINTISLYVYTSQYWPYLVRSLARKKQD